MRFFFLLLTLAGLALGIVYPWAVHNFSGEEIARERVFERGRGFMPVTVTLRADQSPVRVFVDMTSIGAMNLSGDSTVLTLTATVNNQTVLANTLTFTQQNPRPDNPQAGGTIYGDTAGSIDPVVDGDYVFVVGPGDAETVEMRSADLILRAVALTYDARALPIGLVLGVIGFIGFVLSFRGGSNRRPPSEPPQPKWGR